MRKILLAVAVILAALVLGTWLYADSVVGTAVERGSSRAFGTPAHVGMVKLGFMDASIGMSGYRVSGPEGFRDTNLLSIRDTDLKVGYTGIGRDRIEARQLTIDGVELNLLMDGARSNFGPVLQHMKHMSGGAGEPGSPRFVIDRVELEDIGVNIDVPGVERNIELPRIELNDVGGESGVWLSELASIVLGAVMQEAARHGDLPPAARAALGAGLDDLPASIAGAARDRIRSEVEEEARGLLDRAKEAIEGDDDG